MSKVNQIEGTPTGNMNPFMQALFTSLNEGYSSSTTIGATQPKLIMHAPPGGANPLHGISLWLWIDDTGHIRVQSVDALGVPL